VRILVIEDDDTVARYIRKGLDELGYTVDIAPDGKDGLFLATSEAYDVLIVDRMLPEIDGLTVVQTLRASNTTVPVLFLSALGEVDDRVQGLEAGGDDYLTKPFAFSELKARIEALLRRGQGSDTPVTELVVRDLRMDLLARTVERAGQEIDLQPREFRLLEYLMRNAGQVVTRTMLLEHVWDYHFDPQTNVIDVHISRLRGKIDKDFDQALLETVRGAGYRLG
jgi:two-component system OmpR family response regulator